MARCPWILAIWFYTAQYAVESNSEYDRFTTALEYIDYDSLYNDSLLHLDMDGTHLRNSSFPTPNGQFTIMVDADNRKKYIQNTIICEFCKSMRLNSRSGDHIANVNISGDMNFTNGLTVSLWIKHANPVGNCTIWQIGNNTNELLKLRKINNKLIVYHRETTPNIPVVKLNMEDATSLKYGVWNMISFTLDTETNNISLFGNGVNIKGKMITFGVLSASYISLGNGNDGCRYIVVDELAMWNRALNTSELLALRVKPFANNTNQQCCNSTAEEINQTKMTTNTQVATTHNGAQPSDDSTPHKTANPSTEELSQTKMTTNSQVALTDNETQSASSKPHITSTVTTTEEISQTKTTTTTQMTMIYNETQSANSMPQNTLTVKPSQNEEVNVYSVLNKLIDDFKNTQDTANQFTQMELIESTAKHAHFNSENGLSNTIITTDDAKIIFVDFENTTETDNVKYHAEEVDISIPRQLFQTDKTAKIIICIYNSSLTDQLTIFIKSPDSNVSVQSNIISLQINNNQTTFLSPIKMTFPVRVSERIVGGHRYIPMCSYLDGNTWSDNGIKTKEFEHGTVKCEITHLTSFAVLMAVRPVAISDSNNSILSALTYILLTVSVICLILSLLILFCLRELARTQRIQILKHFVTALLCAQLLFVLGTPLFSQYKTICFITSVVQHYLLLSVFAWMLVQGIQLYTKVRLLAGGHIKQHLYVLFAWGLPLPICIIPPIILGEKYSDMKICWIPPDAVYFFSIPAMLIFVINLIITVMVMNTFLTVKVNKDKSKTEKLKSSMRAVIVMIPILGLTWVFGFLIMVDPGNLIFNYLFCILNPLQGVFVFLFHFVLNADVRSAIIRRRNKVAASTENTMFTKIYHNTSDCGDTGITKTSLTFASSTHM